MFFTLLSCSCLCRVGVSMCFALHGIPPYFPPQTPEFEWRQLLMWLQPNSLVTQKYCVRACACVPSLITSQNMGAIVHNGPNSSVGLTWHVVRGGFCVMALISGRLEPLVDALLLLWESARVHAQRRPMEQLLQAAADLTQSPSWYAGSQQDEEIRTQGKEARDRGQFRSLTPFMGACVKNGLQGNLETSSLLQLQAVVCMFSCSCSDSVQQCASCVFRGKIRSEGCEQIRGWAHGKNIK